MATIKMQENGTVAEASNASTVQTGTIAPRKAGAIIPAGFRSALAAFQSSLPGFVCYLSHEPQTDPQIGDFVPVQQNGKAIMGVAAEDFKAFCRTQLPEADVAYLTVKLETVNNETAYAVKVARKVTPRKASTRGRKAAFRATYYSR